MRKKLTDKNSVNIFSVINIFLNNRLQGFLEQITSEKFGANKHAHGLLRSNLK